MQNSKTQFLFWAVSVLFVVSDGKPASMPPKSAQELLEAGNQRFVSGKAIHPRQDPETRSELAKGQKPHTIILSCSDSRVGPELVFDQGLGDIFSVRIAGQILEPSAIASIEYAIEHLGSRLILIMGHESCGAVKAAIATPAGGDTGSPNLNQLVWSLQLNLREEGCVPNPEDKLVREPVKANVSALRKQLIRESKVVREFAEKQGLEVAMGIYSLETGKVQFWK